MDIYSESSSAEFLGDPGLPSDHMAEDESGSSSSSSATTSPGGRRLDQNQLALRKSAKLWSKRIIKEALECMVDADRRDIESPVDGTLRFPGPLGANKYAGGVCLRWNVAGWEARVHGRRVGRGRVDPLDAAMDLVKFCRRSTKGASKLHRPCVRNVMRWSTIAQAWVMCLDSPTKGTSDIDNQKIVQNVPSALAEADSRIWRPKRIRKIPTSSRDEI